MANYQEQIVKLTSSGVWSARPRTGSEWISLPVSNGNGCTARELIVRIEDNLTGGQRVGYVDFTGGSKTCVLTITQLADSGSDTGTTVTDTISLSKSNINSTSAGVSDSVTVTTSKNSWVANGYPSWVTLNKTAGSVGATTVSISVASNSTTSNRTASIVFTTAEGNSATLTISQSGKATFLVVTPSATGVTSASTTVNVSVSSTTSWTASTTTSWLTIGSVTGSAGNTSGVAISVAQNDGTISRSGSVSFVNADGNSATFSVTQAAQSAPEAYLNITNQIVGVQLYTGGLAGSIEVSSSSRWSATSESWVTISPSTSTATTKSVAVSLAENTTGSDRTATITFRNADGKVATTTVSQEKMPIAPALITVSPDSWDFEETGETTGLTVASNEDWFVAENTCDWLTLGAMSGTAGPAGWISLVAGANNTTSRRTGRIVIETTFSHEQATATFTQDKTGYVPPVEDTTYGALYCNTNISSTSAGNGVYVKNDVGTFPDDFFKVSLSANSSDITLEISGTSRCGEDDAYDYNLMFFYPKDADMTDISVWNPLTSQWDSQLPYIVVSDGFMLGEVEYECARFTDDYPTCDNATNKYRLQFNNKITKQ